MTDKVVVCNKEYSIKKMLGHGKGGYSYLAETDGMQVVVKQIHHEPCDYYSFGNKIEAEHRDYERLRAAGIRIPEMISIDSEAEIIVKEYIEGDTIFDYVLDGVSVEPYLAQVREMASQAKAAGLNIDYFPTNFVVQNGLRRAKRASAVRNGLRHVKRASTCETGFDMQNGLQQPIDASACV